ncbi:SMI1/KNR4 family protein [Bernardetia sp. OM2101]|uniref:SMI1/KNR4 family protein n=1 Tax=Bernardetia sp. OM2101 TaxID=3344876 RepID=UPI0035CF3F33
MKEINFEEFWENSDYTLKEYVCVFPSNELVDSIEKELGYKLPKFYIEMMKIQNGGTPKNTCFPTNKATSWADNHVAITGILGIGRQKTYSLCGDLGSQFMIDEWEYPNIGVCICDCPSAGHDMIMLDYRKNGKQGEPQVVHVDQESDYRITFLAENFETFIKGLVHESTFDT